MKNKVTVFPIGGKGIKKIDVDHISFEREGTRQLRDGSSEKFTVRVVVDDLVSDNGTEICIYEIPGKFAWKGSVDDLLRTLKESKYNALNTPPYKTV